MSPPSQSSGLGWMERTHEGAAPSVTPPHCHGCSGAGGTAVALCVPPWGGGTAMAAPGLVALLWQLHMPIPGGGGTAIAVPGLVALLWLLHVSIPNVGGTAVVPNVHPRVGGIAIAAPGLVALLWFHMSIPGLVALLWLCVSIPRVGGTAVVPNVHPWSWWHCHSCSRVGGTAVVPYVHPRVGGTAVAAPCLHPKVGGTAVALCIHPQSWWHCCGSICPSLGLVALLWFHVSIPGVGGTAVAAPCVHPRVGGPAPWLSPVSQELSHLSRAAPFVQVTIVHPARQLPEWRFLFTLFYGAFEPHVLHHQAVLIVVLSPSMAILPQHSLLLGAFYLVKKRKKQKIFLPSETSTPPLSPFSLV
ncbi:uncharacterized protein LOC134430732 isoform X2 [Melospiza melodia melodia]|uniref:uncharacterized protein LOC134430732 isoform X2 n=1 Tax=Melospiza melodia melodia TaxID=1914991 RepID=UPI002FD3BA0F